MTAAISSNQIDETRKATIAQELAKLAKRGIITPQDVVAAARKKTHPLHEFFEWDNSEAARMWRLHQARLMIVSWKMITQFRANEAAEPMRAVLPTFEAPGEWSPRPVVLSNESSRKEFIRRKLVELRSWCASVRDVRELDALREWIESHVKDKDG